MLAGVPLVMFKLPGISSEYDNYIMYANSETAESLAEKIDEVLNFSEEKWEEVATEARTFIREKKNNLIQSKKVLDFI